MLTLCVQKMKKKEKKNMHLTCIEFFHMLLDSTAINCWVILCWRTASVGFAKRLGMLPPQHARDAHAQTSVCVSVGGR